MINNKYRISYNNLFMLNPKRCRNYFLIQAGESLCAKDTIIPVHQQNYFEITYVVSGKGISYTNDIPVEIGKNDCFLSFPNETHKIVSDEQDPLRFIFLAFYAKQKTQGNTLINYITQACQAPNNRNYHIESLHALCSGILKELRDEDMYSERAIALLLEQILIECSRNISQKTKSTPQSAPTNAAILTHDIITYIDQNIFKIKKISDLENVFFYNINNLSKYFHSQMGIPLNTYFISKKMEAALQLLQAGESVTQVSDKLQYSSIHAFSRAYKNYFNESPSKSQKKNPNE
ncbi:MAG: helix-turn-helix domain-containing protein [Clostridiales bacterium]|nr:helix-turn-helix domain-containing protein [Clostridiales bacterium]